MKGDVGVMAIVVVDILGEFDYFAFRPCVVCSSIRSSQRGKFGWAICNS